MPQNPPEVGYFHFQNWWNGIWNPESWSTLDDQSGSVIVPQNPPGRQRMVNHSAETVIVMNMKFTGHV